MSHKPTNDTRSRPMTAETIHTCSYSCERPGCIRAQRDELVAKVESLWAEVEAWKESFCQAASRAERLAEALRHQRWCRTCAEDGWESCEEGRKNDALLRDQEEGK